MEYETQLKLQAYLDGELPEPQQREVASWLAKDREAVTLFQELRNTRQALVGTEIGVTLPESREFFWSKIQREIERQTLPELSVPRVSLFAAWRKFLIPASAAAALGLAVLLGFLSNSNVGLVQTAVADPGAFTYHDFSAGTTLVWFSFPADNDFD